MLKYKLYFISSTYSPNINILKRFGFLLPLALFQKIFLGSEIKSFLLINSQTNEGLIRGPLKSKGSLPLTSVSCFIRC